MSCRSVSRNGLLGAASCQHPALSMRSFFPISCWSCALVVAAEGRAKGHRPHSADQPRSEGILDVSVDQEKRIKRADRGSRSLSSACRGGRSRVPFGYGVLDKRGASCLCRKGPLDPPSAEGLWRNVAGCRTSNMQEILLGIELSGVDVSLQGILPGDWGRI